jgi:transposase
MGPEVPMPAPVPVALRLRVVALYIPYVVTYEMLAELFDIGRATVSRILRLHRETGSVEPKAPSGGPAPMLGVEELLILKAMVTETPDATLEELVLAARWPKERTGVSPSTSTLSRGLDMIGYTWKKRSGHGRWTPRAFGGSGRSTLSGSRSRTQRS